MILFCGWNAFDAYVPLKIINIFRMRKQKGESLVLEIINTIIAFIYNIIIGPIIFLYGILFSLISKSFNNPVISICFFSLAVNFLVLPLYNKADKIQKENQKKKEKITPGIDHIKKTYHGDEQLMMLQTYYRIQGYSTLDYFKEALPILLQIPMFIAAYRYLSSLEILNGAQFGPIKNLMKPDHLLTIQNIHFNVLPVLMTGINYISSYVYSKNNKEKFSTQALITGAIFFILLYNSPSGLVIYWTANQIFSLVKNLLVNFPDKYKKFLAIIGGLAFVLGANALCYIHLLSRPLCTIIEYLYSFYLAVVICPKKIINKISCIFSIKEKESLKDISKLTTIIMIELAIVLFLGIFIPSSVISSSAKEFINETTGSVPFSLLTYPAIMFAGIFLFWMTTIFIINDKKEKTWIIIMSFAFLLFTLINHFVFSWNFGTLYTDLTFDGSISFPDSFVDINILTGFVLFEACIFIYNKKPSIIKNTATIIAAAMLCISVYHIGIIYFDSSNIKSQVKTNKSYENIFELSKTKKNVIVLMLDRGIGGYAPFIFDELPELKESYKGFVYYPNTISFGRHTMFGSPTLFGGYEYTPSELNKREDKTLVDKHTEALSVMPVIFHNNGYDISICDPPAAGYKHVPDLSIYDKYPDFKTENLTGKFSGEFLTKKNDFEFRQKRNFIVYSMYRTAPLILREILYDDGQYLYNINSCYTPEFISSYSALRKYPELTIASEKDKGSFLMIQNATTHNPISLEAPDYNVDKLKSNVKLKKKITKKYNGHELKISTTSHWAHYCVNIISYKEIAKWLDYMKEIGVYDNTRIIIASDHGWYLKQYKGLYNKNINVEKFNPLLMVKDFNSNKPLSIDEKFMTNADVPLIAMNGLINDPVNPFTGKNITDDKKQSGELYITDVRNGVPGGDSIKFDLSDNKWWTVHDYIFDLKNWKKIKVEDIK